MQWSSVSIFAVFILTQEDLRFCVSSSPCSLFQEKKCEQVDIEFLYNFKGLIYIYYAIPVREFPSFFLLLLNDAYICYISNTCQFVSPTD